MNWAERRRQARQQEKSQLPLNPTLTLAQVAGMAARMEEKGMIIVSKEKNEAYNLEQAERIYIGFDKPAVKIVVGSTRAGNLGEYGSFEKARKALEMVMNDIGLGRKAVVYMPNDEMVTDKYNEKEHCHHITGKKTKGHGGS